MRTFAGLLMLVLVASAACSHPAPYWVSGLDLPQGSTNVQVTGQSGSVLMVSFDNTHGWVDVVKEVESDLKAQGYTRSELPAGVDISGGTAGGSSIMWTKPGSHYFVDLEDQTQINEFAKSRGHKPGPGFLLNVTKH